jgi:hypothetical protein
VADAQRRLIERTAREAFKFLEQRPGCRVKVANVRHLYKMIIYLFSDVVFEVNLDWYDETVNLMICRPIGGRPPEAVRVHEGRRVRLYFYEALTFAGEAGRAASADLVQQLQRITAKERSRKAKMEPTAAMIARTHAESDALRRTIDWLPEYYDAIFGPQDTSVT